MAEPRRAEGAPRIVMVGSEVLWTPTTTVTNFGPDLADLVARLFASLALAEGVGLAAPQIGVGLSVLVYDCPDGSGRNTRGHVVNPTIETFGAVREEDEGCLSVPGPYHKLGRHERATVHGLDQHGDPVEVSGSGYFARCLQHETDHLRGTLYIDHLPRNRRRRVLREMEPYEWNEPPS